MAGMVKHNVRLEGRRPVLFNRYPGDNDTQLPPEKKFYFGEDKKTLIFPSLNLFSMICATNSNSAAKLFFDMRAYKRVAFALSGSFEIEPAEIPFLRDGKPITFEGFDQNGITLSTAVPRVKGGIPNPCARPVLDTPWALEFSLAFLPTEFCSEESWRELWVFAGQLIGIGSYRGPYGKFSVAKWEEVRD